MTGFINLVNILGDEMRPKGRKLKLYLLHLNSDEENLDPKKNWTPNLNVNIIYYWLTYANIVFQISVKSHHK